MGSNGDSKSNTKVIFPFFGRDSLEYQSHAMDEYLKRTNRSTASPRPALGEYLFV